MTRNLTDKKNLSKNAIYLYSHQLRNSTDYDNKMLLNLSSRWFQSITAPLVPSTVIATFLNRKKRLFGLQVRLGTHKQHLKRKNSRLAWLR